MLVIEGRRQGRPSWELGEASLKHQRDGRFGPVPAQRCIIAWTRGCWLPSPDLCGRQGAATQVRGL